MTREKKGDFCEGESEEHCGCMRVETCTSLAVELIRSYGGKMPGGIRRYYDAYNQNASIENERALCKAVWEHINPALRAFMQSYQKYISKNDVHELLDQLIESNDRAPQEETCGDCVCTHEGGVDVHTIVIV